MIIDFFRNIGRYVLRPFFARYWKRLVMVLLGSYTVLSVGHQQAWFRSPLMATNPLEAFSEDTALLLELPAGKGLPSDLLTADYAPALLQLSILDKWKKGVHLLDSLFHVNEKYQQLLEETTIISGVQVTSNRAANWLYVLHISARDFQSEEFIAAIRPKHIQKSTFRNCTVYTLKLADDQECTFTLFRGLVLFSPTTILVESSIEQLYGIKASVHRNEAFQAIAAVPRKQPTWNIYLNFKAIPSLTNVVTTSNPSAILGLRQAGDWMRLDAQFLPKDFNLTGKLYPEADNVFLQALAQQEAPKNSRMIELFPSNLGAMLYVGWGDFNSFYGRYSKEKNADFEKYIKPWLGQDGALFYEDLTDNENGFEKNKLVFLHSKDTSLTWKLLDRYAKREGKVTRYGYQNFEITHLPIENVLKPLFGSTINPLQAPYFTIIGEYIVLANSKSTLEGWIKRFNNEKEKTLLELPTYQAFLKQSSKQANIYMLINTPNVNKFIQYIGRDSLSKKHLQATWKGFQNIYPIGIKLHGQGDNFLTTFSASYNQVTNKEKVTATEAWQADLNSKAAIAPKVLFSHDGNYYILIQDERRQLYLFDKNGENKWPAHKRTNRLINSPIFEVDYYNNDEIQYGFSTDSAIYIFTKEGENLMTIPLIHRAASGVLAMNNGKGPRFFIPCRNGAVYGYEETGRPLSGWQPLKGAGRAGWPMQYMNYNGERYFILVTTAGHCHAYEQSAKVHFKHASLGKPTSWGVDPSIGRIAAGQVNGKIKMVNPKGKSFSFAAVPQLKKKVQFLYADVVGDARKDYIRMDANQMIIHYYEKQTDEKGRTKDKLQQTEIYTIPEAKDRQVFEVDLEGSSKKMIGYWEPNTNSIGLLNARGELQQGFPLAGTSTFEVVDLFEEQSNTLIVANDSRVYTYKLK
ncbi:MAG: DUF3352 domain-containing protein [Aureispira sp.]